MTPRTSARTNGKKGKPVSEPRGAVAEPAGFNPHLAFFDRDGDGKISPHETRVGLERLGIGYALSVPGGWTINLAVTGLGVLRKLALSPLDLPLPAAGFVRHPDTRLIDEQGTFVQARLDALFARHARTFPAEALTLPELFAMATREVHRVEDGLLDTLLIPGSALAVLVEWTALWWVGGSTREGKAVLEKDVVKRFYTDPRFFEDMAQLLEIKREQRSKTVLGRARNVLQTWLL